MAAASEFYLAALLFDLRILFPPGKWVAKHAEFFSRYADVRALTSLLDGTGEGSVFPRASALAGEGAPLEGSGDLYPLKSVFSHLRVSSDQSAPAVYSPQAPLSPEGIFPVPDREKPDRAAITAALDRDMALLEENPPEDLHALLTCLDFLFQRNLWAVPGGCGGETDISLYDRMRVTAAVSYCLQVSEPAQEKPYLMLAADFSGIRTYIFSGAGTGAREMSRRLRARSFLMDVMVETLAYRVCDTLDVPYGNLLTLAGGKFYLLVPNTQDTAARLRDLADRTAEELFTRFSGEISVNLAQLAVGDEGLLDYSSTLTELSRRLREQKLAPFHPVLTNSGHWREEKFVLDLDPADAHTCPSCGKPVAALEEGVCPRCRRQEQLGDALAGAQTLWLSRGGGTFELWDGYYLSFSPQEARGDLIRVEQLNHWEITPGLTAFPLNVRLMASYLPVSGGEPLTFDEIAALSPGRKQLAVLRADVDNLGFLISDGMREEGRCDGTISRVCTLSRLLEWFFSGHVSHLLEREYPTVYSVFSGGDDLFLIGSWDVTRKMALRIHDEFTRFTGGNPCVTLSAAIALSSPRANLALLAQSGEEELNRVKDSAPQSLYPGRAGGDGISAAGEIFSWEDFSAQLSSIDTLRPCVEGIPRPILGRIMNYSAMYRRFLLDHDVMGLMFEPLFTYDLTRNYAGLDREKLNPFFQYVKRLTHNVANYHEVNRDLYFAEFVIACILNESKEAHENVK